MHVKILHVVTLKYDLRCSWWDTTNCGGNVSYDYLKLGLSQHARGSDPERMKVLNIFSV